MQMILSPPPKPQGAREVQIKGFKVSDKINSFGMHGHARNWAGEHRNGKTKNRPSIACPSRARLQVEHLC